MVILSMTIYNNITKPIGTAYTNQNSIGKEQYDQSTLSYDNSGTFYDGVNQGLYISVTKPSGTSYTKISKP